jgi:hypothetical protein
MVNDQLAPPLEQLRQSFLAPGPVENVILVDTLPGQFPALLAQLVAQPGELFFLGQELRAGREPFIVRNDLWCCITRPRSPML